MYLFKNAVLFRADLAPIVEDLDLSKLAFKPRPSSYYASTGWVEPIKDAGLHFAGDGFIALELQTESAILPPDAIAREVAERVTEREERDGRKIHKKERDEIKEDVIVELLPKALSKFSSTRVLLLPEAGLIVVDTGSHSKAEDVVAFLRKTVGSLNARPVDVANKPLEIMTLWLKSHRNLQERFQIDHACQLVDPSASASTVTLKEQDLYSDESQAHIQAGMFVSKLALIWNDHFRFTLHDDLTIHKLKLTGEGYDAAMTANEDADTVEEATKADMFMMATELSRLHFDLCAAMGGEQLVLKEAV